MNSNTGTSPEAVERLAQHYDAANEILPDPRCNLTSSTLRALSAALEAAEMSAKHWHARAEAAEAERDALKEQLAKQGRELNMAKYGQPDFAWSVHVAAMGALKAELAEAVEVLTLIESIRPMWEGGVRGPSADNLSNTLEHMRAEARAFVTRHQKKKD